MPGTKSPAAVPATYASHFSCWRSSPVARRNRRTRATTAETAAPTHKSPGMMKASHEPSPNPVTPNGFSTRRVIHQPGATLPLRATCPQCHEPLEIPGDYLSLFGVGFLGYTGARTWEKAKGVTK